MANVASTASSGESRAPAARGGGSTAFSVYKPGQGYWTRMGSFLGGLVLVAWGALFVRSRLEMYAGNEAWQLAVYNGIPLAVFLGMLYLLFYFVYGNRKSSDFMIATEGEMKKVNWSTRREIIGSTKVVILFTVLMSLMLLIVDVGFMEFFSLIGVLKR
jgi:preprotein translocase subunit SecE